jgi:hypothetical protein
MNPVLNQILEAVHEIQLDLGAVNQAVHEIQLDLTM